MTCSESAGHRGRAGADAVRDLDVVGLKLRGFTLILDAEQPHLPNIKAMIAKMRGFNKLSDMIKAGLDTH